MPQCEVCGDCYYQWKVTLDDLSRNVSVEISRAYNISLTPNQPVGNINAYSKELQELEDKLKRVEMILENQVTTANDTIVIEKELDSVNMQLETLQEKVEKMSDELNSTEMRNSQANVEIDLLRQRLANLLRNGSRLQTEMETILRSDTRGAYDKILENQVRSREAEAKVDVSMSIIEMSEEQRNKTENLIAGPPSFSDKHGANTASLFDISEILIELLDLVNILNGIVCGTPMSQCGGCGVLNCSTCGGPGCNGSKDLAAEALEKAIEAERAQRMRESKAKEMLKEVEDAETMVNMTREAADQAMMQAMDADQRAKNASARMDQLIQDILDFLSQVFGDTDKVQEIADSVKKLKLSVTPEEITKLAEDITKALNSLTGIDDILEETEQRLNKANDLKERAEKARAKAKAVTDVIVDIEIVLTKTTMTQKAAKDAIDAAEDDIKTAEDILNKLLAALDSLEKAVDTAQGNVTDMESKLPMVREQYQKNQEQLAITEKNAMDAHNQSQIAMREANNLLELFEQARDRIDEKVESVGNASTKVQDLQSIGNALVRNLQKKLERILVVERETILFEDLIQQVKKLQDEMKVLLDKLEKRYACYLGCSPDTSNNPCFED